MYIYYYTDKDIPEIKIAGKSIIRKDGRKVTLEVEENDSSFRYRALMKKPQFVLKFSLPAFVEIPVGAWCEFLGQTFTLTDPENIKKNGVRNIEYTMMMGTDEDLMSLYKMRNSVDHRLKYSMCATPKEFIQEIVANLNSRTGGGWTVGTCIESSPKTIEFNHVYIDNALQLVADIFKTEWENVDKTISLRKVEYFKNDPLPLSYGKGNGFIPGVGRTSQSDEKPIKRLYVQGGDKNIDYSKYGSKTLLLPKSQTLDYEGRKYQTDADGYYIERIDKISDAVKDDSLDLSEIYPSRVGEVSDVIAVKPEKNFYDIVDTSIPDNLDYNKYLIEGETMTIIFQSGMLAGDGKEFEVTYHHTAKTVNGVLKAARRFEIVPQEIDGQIMPNEVFKPAVGDSYAIFGCSLPQEYICDNDSKTGASWDMFREGARMLYEHEDQKFTFTGTLQGLYAKRNWLKIGGRLKVGAYILFSDPQFAEEGVSIRITGIKEFLTSPYTPTIEISNSVSGSSTQSKINHIDSIDVEIDNATKTIINFTKRRFRDALQTIEMLEAAQLNFSESVNPITVQTMAALIGDESLQFRFVKSKINLTPASYLITYDNVKKQLHCPHGFLQHMTLGISSVSSSHKDSEYKVWEMSEYTSPVLTDGSKKYYLYARVSSTNTAEKGEFLLSETGIAIDSESGYYHLLAGVLNSELEEERSYVDLYGFTEILPGRITTDRIVSSEGSSFFDLLNNAMKLGDALDFNTKGDGKMRVKGTIVQSESGDESYIGCFRGTYNNKYVYYNGDEVTYTVNGLTSTYRYIFAQPTKGIPPTDATHWKVIAQGSKGEDGFGYEYIYKRTATEIAPDTPTAVSQNDGFVPSGWTDDPSGVSAEYPYEWLCYRKQTDGVWGAFKGSFSDPTKASLWGKYAVMTNLNMLEGTGFQNNDVLRAWDVVNQVSPKSGVTVNDYNIGILTGSDGFQGRNAFRGGTKYSLKSINYKEILRQPIRQKLKPSTWYTLSYWARCGGDSFMYEDIVGSAYPFQTYDIYLTTGKKYQMSIQGFISPDAANAGKTLRVYINNTTWSWSKMVEINSTANTTASIEFDDVPSDGEYKIGAYSYPNTTPAVDVTVRRLYLVCLTKQTVTYVYPSCIDTTVKGFVDGVEKTISSDGATNLGWGHWAFHTFTFKTKATLPTAEQYVLFRLMPALTEKGNIYCTDICMPKLEEGKEATPYKEHDNDSHAPYYELRYAKNGSTKVPPALSVSMREPSGWSTVQPSVGELEYLWQTTAKKNFDGSLIENWSTPVRITPYDGKDGADGKSPALVFRGVYNASKNYYGNANRVDCVKYNSTYYRARIDAPNGTAGFSGHAPTDSDYWNAFGASFESVATDLLLAENASIGDWFHSGGKIVSTLSTGNKIELDASIPKIKVTSEQSGGDYSEDTSLGSEITISGSTGVIRTQAKTSSSKVSYMSPSGIFSNVAETQAVSSITGYVRKAAMVALGYGSLAKSTWEMNKDEAMLAGVYGVANNNTYNGAPAYGGYFYDLKACGLILNVQYISDSNSEYTTLDKSASQIISLTNKDVTRKVYLPSDAYVGRVVFLHQMGAGALRVYAGLGQHIYDDTTENTYYDIFEGQTLMAIFGIWSRNNVQIEVWIVRRFKY